MRKQTVRNSHEWPYNLIAEILNNDGELPEKLPHDIEPSLYYVLLKLTERENLVIAMFYRDKKTMSAIGREFCITTERVRQIINKSLRRLRSPHSLVYIESGITNLMKFNSDEAHRKGYALGYAQGLKVAGGDLPERAMQTQSLKISEMDLSVRAFNCLCRANLRTSDEIARCDYHDLIKIRNLGRRTLNEIIEKMEHLGYETKHMMEPIGKMERDAVQYAVAEVAE